MLYGFFLSLTHVWSFLYWKQGDFFIHSQSGLNSEALCFPFFPNCDIWRGFLSLNQWSLVLWSYGLVSFIVALLFLFPKKSNLAYWGFALITLIKLFLHLRTLVVNVIFHLGRWKRLIILRFQWNPQCLIRAVRIVVRPLQYFFVVVTTNSRITEEGFELILG